MALLRTLLIVGRVSNLPTLWSNCLAGWWLGGAGNADRLPLLRAGASLIFLGRVTGALGVVLLLLIVLYNAFHKQIVWAPVLMAACRFLVYVIAASTAANGVTGWSLWGGLALALYIAGLSILARREVTPRPASQWPALLLAAPI